MLPALPIRRSQERVPPGDPGLHHGGVPEERIHGPRAERHAVWRGRAGAHRQGIGMIIYLRLARSV